MAVMFFTHYFSYYISLTKYYYEYYYYSLFLASAAVTLILTLHTNPNPPYMSLHLAVFNRASLSVCMQASTK